MKYNKLGKTDIMISSLGFGCMRFPTLDDKTENIDIEESVKMVRYAIDNGVNYIDTAYPYHGGKSENFVAKALKDGYREKVKIADKLPIWFVKNKEDLDKYLNEQIARLEGNFIDFYLMHALNKDRFETIKKFDVCKWCEEKKKENKIGYIGFSFHDDIETFKEIIDYYDWDFCQIQLNYMDINHQAGLEGLKYAYERNIPVIVMEPIKGGSLAVKPMGEIKELFTKANYQGSPAELALKWVWNQPGVTLLLSGMSTLNQVKENIETADKSGLGCLTKIEKQIIEEIRQIFNNKVKVKCTNCKYCVPCEQGVDIPTIFSMYNEFSMYNNRKNFEMELNSLEKGKKGPSSCVECGMCEEKCPQHIEIINELKNVINAK